MTGSAAGAVVGYCRRVIGSGRWVLPGRCRCGVAVFYVPPYGWRTERGYEHGHGAEEAA